MAGKPGKPEDSTAQGTAPDGSTPAGDGGNAETPAAGTTTPGAPADGAGGGTAVTGGAAAGEGQGSEGDGGTPAAPDGTPAAAPLAPPARRARIRDAAPVIVEPNAAVREMPGTAHIAVTDHEGNELAHDELFEDPGGRFTYMIALRRIYQKFRWPGQHHESHNNSAQLLYNQGTRVPRDQAHSLIEQVKNAAAAAGDGEGSLSRAAPSAGCGTRRRARRRSLFHGGGRDRRRAHAHPGALGDVSGWQRRRWHL